MIRFGETERTGVAVVTAYLKTGIPPLNSSAGTEKIHGNFVSE
jgi:hypothetical protein